MAKIGFSNGALLGITVSGVPVGSVYPFAMSTPSSGWLECDGSTISRATYSDLFSAIGEEFGAGDGSTTFEIPDLRGEFVRGWDNSRGIDAARAFASSQADSFQGHWHTFGDSVAGQNVNNVGGGGSTNWVAGNSNTLVKSPYTDGTNGVPRTAAETRPRNIALMYCIKY